MDYEIIPTELGRISSPTYTLNYQRFFLIAQMNTTLHLYQARFFSDHWGDPLIASEICQLQARFQLFQHVSFFGEVIHINTPRTNTLGVINNVQKIWDDEPGSFFGAEIFAWVEEKVPPSTFSGPPVDIDPTKVPVLPSGRAFTLSIQLLFQLLPDRL